VTPVRKLFKNGYEVTPKGLYSPSYALNSPGARTQVPLERADATPLAPQKALDPYKWTDIAVQNNLIPLGGRLHSFQIAAANLVLMQRGDGVIISPTGSGKSLTWVLPLLACQKGISLIITPYTSLGLEGELL
jgi:superfamily II DNA or RNA helicase